VSHIGTRPLATIATIFLVAGGVLVAAYAFGEYALGRMMADDALTRADLWVGSLSRSGDLEATLAETSPETLDGTLRIANIDRVMIVPQGQSPLPIYGPDAGAELTRVVTRGGSPGALDGVASGSYTLDGVSWFQRAPFHSWVLLPPEKKARARLAVRLPDRHRRRYYRLVHARGVVQRRRRHRYLLLLHGGRNTGGSFGGERGDPFLALHDRRPAWPPQAVRGIHGGDARENRAAAQDGAFLA
jgi:hypothetical protein